MTRFYRVLVLLACVAVAVLVTLWPPAWVWCLTWLLVDFVAVLIVAGLDTLEERGEFMLVELRHRAMFSRRGLNQREYRRLEHLLDRHSSRISSTERTAV